MIAKLCFFLFVCAAFFACTPFEPDTVREQQFNLQRCSDSNSDIVDVNELKPVDIKNASDYTLRGSCSSDNTELEVFLEGYPVSRKPLCNLGKWSLSVDVTHIVSQKERFQLVVSQGGRGGRVCRQVDNHFVCPEGYIGVPKAPGFTTTNFCVMKYEARFKPGAKKDTSFTSKAESRSDGTPITKITLTQAVRFCKENGLAYDLISNEEWQSIARAIEMEDDNWSEGEASVIQTNRLNTGNSDKSVQTTSSVADEEDGWSDDKRTHRLINGAHIWDFAGNLWELVQHSIDTKKLPDDYTGYIYDLPQNLRDLFGPRRDYSTLSSWDITNHFAGLGYAHLNNFKGILIRGGGGGNRRESGIFSVDSTLSDTRLLFRGDVGFRCVYYP